MAFINCNRSNILCDKKIHLFIHLIIKSFYLLGPIVDIGTIIMKKMLKDEFYGEGCEK
jgi:hypothetical protein